MKVLIYALINILYYIFACLVVIPFPWTLPIFIAAPFVMMVVIGGTKR